MEGILRRLQRLENAWDEQLTTEIRELLELLKVHGMTEEELLALINQVQAEAAGSQW